MQITNLNSQMTNNFQITTHEKPKIYDLEERTFLFAKNVALFCKKLPQTSINFVYIDQVVRASGSTGANYIEANEALSKKDFFMRIKISRKEAKESAYWMRLIIETNDKEYEIEGKELFNEAIELKKIFSKILLKNSN